MLKDVIARANNLKDKSQINCKGMQSLEVLIDWQINERKFLKNSGVYGVKVHEDNNIIKIIFTIPPKKSIGLHWHDCAEQIQVIGGTLTDTEKNKTFHVGNEIVYSLSQPHNLHNFGKIDCYYISTFYK